MTTIMRWALLILGLLIASASAKSYDFVIVGGGSTGSVIAGRLSENKKTDVLLLERGEDRCHIFQDLVGYWNADYNERSELSADFRSKSIWDTHYYSREIDQNSRYLSMAFQAGGTALRNGGVFGRMAEADLARFNSSLWTWNATTEDWKDLFYHELCNTNAGCNTEAHGTRGILHTTTYPPDENVELARDALMEAFNLSWNPDSNSRSNFGVSLMHRNIKVVDGKPYRQEPYCSYLKPLLSERKNLEMETLAMVLKIVLKNSGKHEVHYLQNGEVKKVKAKKEVIITAGSIETPKILQLSGIGDCNDITPHGIDCEIENRHVGHHVQDLSMDGLIYINPSAATDSPGSVVVAYHPDGHEVAAATLKITVAPGVVYNGMMFLSLDLNLQANGSVTILNSDPFQAPNISLNVYTHVPGRIDRLRGTLRTVRHMVDKINQEKGFSYFTAVAPTYASLPVNATDAQIDAYIKGAEGASIEWHYVSSTAMHLVVNERLKLIKGNGQVVPGIRIAGNGIMPANVMRSHATSSFSMFVGQVASRLIKEDYNL